MIQSMTGFGRATGALSTRYFVSISAKSVNHRFLETSVRMPEFFWELESLVRSIASETFSRGKLDISIRVQRTAQPEYSVRINAQIANAVIPQLKGLAQEHGISSSMSGGDLMRIPDLLQVEPLESEIEEGERDALAAILRQALGQLQTMRAKEGQALRADLEQRLKRIGELHHELAGHREDVRREALAAYKERVGQIADAAGVAVDADRIAQEVVLMVEKGDIAEEITRLTAHVDQFGAAIKAKEPAGKKLDFLSQEMLREINTMGSKSRAATIRALVVELKTEVERIREQVQNVE
jgi:uncharacterized protein (TIGR00255 family)